MTQRLSWLIAGVLAASLFAQQAVAGDKVAAQAAANEAKGSAAQAVLNLDDLVREAVAKNPGVQSALHTYRARLDRVPQVQALPDPKVGAGWNGKIAPFVVRDGFPPSYRSVQVSEQIPFPGKLGLRGDIAAQEAKAAWWQYESARRQVVAQVKTAYYQYYFLAKAIDITQKNKDLLEKLSEIAEARYRVGKGVQQDVLKAQTEVSLLISRLTVLQQDEDTAKARINTLLARDPDAPLPPPAEVRPAVLGFTLDDLYRMAARNDTGLQRAQQVVKRNQYAVSLARKDYLPDFGVAYMYQQRPMLPDTQGFVFTVNVPVFYKSKQREAEREAAEQEIAASKAQDNQRNEVNFDVKQAYLAAKASENLAQLYSKAVVPQASLALESSMSSYQVGNVDFLSVLADFSNVLDYQIDYYREIAAFQTALAQLEPLVGVELTGEAGPSPAVTPEPK
jgi:outer membrane protein, heavy metal efflux system